jgi:hypothetical protein
VLQTILGYVGFFPFFAGLEGTNPFAELLILCHKLDDIRSNRLPEPSILLPINFLQILNLLLILLFILCELMNGRVQFINMAFFIQHLLLLQPNYLFLVNLNHLVCIL